MPRYRPLLLTVALALGLGALPTLAAPLDEVFDTLAGDACDPLDPTLCLLPFPNDHFTVADPDTDTGRRVAFHPAAMPRVAQDTKPVDPTEWNRNDGFSPGSMVITFVPGLDLHQTWGTTEVEPPEHRDHIADIARYAAADAPILLINADTGERHPFWSELDLHRDTGDDERLLILRPAVNLDEATRYLVALRHLRDADGDVIPAGEAFAAYLTGDGPDAGRQEDIDRIVDELEDAEVARGNAFDRDDLHLAWEFTVASAENLAGRALAIRDDAFARLGDEDLADGVIEGDAPDFVVEQVEPRGDEVHVHGRISVPNYLTQAVGTPDLYDPTGNTSDRLAPFYVPGSRFFYPPGSDLPEVNPAMPEFDAWFTCRLPASVLDTDGDVEPARPVLLGHGLLGQRYEVGFSSGHLMAREHNTMYCGTEWIGMALGDVPNVAVIIADVSHFASLADRAQQGFLNFMFLGRAMIHPDGFASHDAFQGADGQPLLDTSELFYEGNSQGGIMGGALTALAPDFTKSVLGVPGMNYSTLLNRNTGGWEDGYGEVFYLGVSDSRTRQLFLALIQMLWDRAEANGYAHHMTDDPYPNTPAKQVLLHVAYGDYQVANVSAEVEARTIGARVLHTALPAGRHWAVDPLFDLEPFDVGADGAVLPHTGSALVYWDSGNPVPPNGNVPPPDEEQDPHGDPRAVPQSGVQRVHFLETGEVIDVYSGAPYCTHQFPRHPELFPDGCPER
jgi:hypothetical protein